MSSGTGTAARRREPTSSVPPDLSTSRTRCSAIGRTGLTVGAGLLVTSVMKTANKVKDLPYYAFSTYFLLRYIRMKEEPWYYCDNEIVTQRWKNVQTLQTRLCYFFSFAVLIFWLYTHKLAKNTVLKAMS